MAGVNKQETTATTKDVLSPGQLDFLNSIISMLGMQVGQGVESYPGQIVPGVSGLQQQGFDALSGVFGGETGGALSRLLSGQSAYEVDPAARQQLYDAEKAMVMRQFRSEVAPMIEERYNAAGGGRSGGLQRSLAQAGGDLSLGLGSLYSNLGYQDEMARRAGLESAAGRQATGLGLWGGLTGQQLDAGQMQRGILGEQLSEGYQSWLSRQPYMNPYMTQWAPMALGVTPKGIAQEGSGWGFSVLGG